MLAVARRRLLAKISFENNANPGEGPASQLCDGARGAGHLLERKKAKPPYPFGARSHRRNAGYPTVSL